MFAEITFGEIAGLERELENLGGSVPAASLDEFLRGLAQWWDRLPSTLAEQLGSDTISELADVARSTVDDKTRNLAIGALVALQRDSTKRASRARFAARFALRRARTSLGRAPSWSGATLTASDQADAIALFDAAKGDRSFGNDELIRGARLFLEQHQRSSGAAGRLASDLQFLVRVVDERDPSEPEYEIARAALTYLAVVADAIPDDIGMIGFLDDAFVVQRAVAEILPRRGTIEQSLDALTLQWPFIADVALGFGDDGRSLSEFIAVSVSILRSGANARPTRAALVVSTVGPLPILCGFLRSLAEAGKLLADARGGTFQPGDRLENRVTGAEVVFDGYRTMSAGSFVRCAPDQATHFAFTAGEGKRRFKSNRLVTDLQAFTSSARSGRRLRAGDVRYNRSTITLGPLERLFGSTEPVSLPSASRRVIVVTAIGAAQQVLQDLRLHDVPLADVIPITCARLDCDSIDERPLSETGPGGTPLLTLVRTTAEALEIVEQEPAKVAAVVAALSSKETDAGNLVRIASSGVDTLVIGGERDAEDLRHLDARGFAFWWWSAEWVRALRWHDQASNAHPVAAYEDTLRMQADAVTDVLPVECTDLDDAYSHLSRVRELASGDVLLERFVAVGFALQKMLRLAVVKLGSVEQARCDAELSKLREIENSGRQWWRDDAVAATRLAMHALARATVLLRECNPKAEAIGLWLDENADGVVICSPTQGRQLENAFPRRPNTWAARVDAPQTKVLLPGWTRMDQMDRVLLPPGARQTSLVLYRAERALFGATVHRHQRTRAALCHAVATRSAVPTRRELFRLPETSQTAPDVLDADVVIAAGRHAAVLESIARSDGEEVQAILVHFAGGSWAPFKPGYRVRTATHLLGGVPSDGDGLREGLASDLRSGDLVVLLRGSDRDAIRDTVDRLAPVGMRELATAWQSALRKHSAGHSVGQLVTMLAAEGCERRPATVTRWLDDDTMIRPRHGRRDVEAIARVTNDAALLASLDACVGAAEELFALHVRAGQQLTARVLKEASDWLNAGLTPDGLVEVDDRVVLVTVEFIDTNARQVPRALVNRLQGVP